MENYDPNSSPGGIAALFAIFAALMIPIFIVSIIVIIAQWKIYSKAGKPGWACIIPIYNVIVLLEIVGKPIWWIFLYLIPCVNIVFGIWTINLLSKSFGKEEGFTVGLILLPFVFYPILGFGDATYVGPAAAEAKQFNAGNYQDPFNNTPPTPPPTV
jgi:hypothetical protein